MSKGYYTGGRARRSLLHFGLGKLSSALLGVLLLIWLVRLLPAREYGSYIALLALLEIFYLLSGLGLSTLAQRYVAEFRLKAPARQFGRFLRGLVLRRAGQASAGALLLGLALPQLAQWWGLPLAPGVQWLFAAWLISGSLTRYMDELLPALLLQGVTQGLNALANLLRLGAIAAWVHAGTALDHRLLVSLELGVSCLIALAGAVALWRHLRLHPGAADGPLHHNAEMMRVARRFYLVQVLGQLWSGNAAKLLVTRLAGVGQTALFGFCLAMVDMLRNYLPAYMLANWVRPLMVAQYLQTRSIVPVAEMANAIFKLSLIGLLPFAAFFLNHGDAFAGLVSKGRYSEGAGLLLAALVLMAVLQCLHIVVGMVSTTLERAGANIWATALGALALPLAWLLHGLLGLPGVVLAFSLADACWSALVLYALSRQGLTLPVDWAGNARILLAGLLAAALLAVLPAPPGWWLLGLLLLAAALVMGLLVLLKPLRAPERALLQRVLPARWIVW